eukprot:s562_g15.t1
MPDRVAFCAEVLRARGEGWMRERLSARTQKPLRTLAPNLGISVKSSGEMKHVDLLREEVMQLLLASTAACKIAILPARCATLLREMRVDVQKLRLPAARLSVLPSAAPAALLAAGLAGLLQQPSLRQLLLPWLSVYLALGSRLQHRAAVRIQGRALLCDWPAEEANQATYNITLEDAKGELLSNVVAAQKPGLLGLYGTVACVRDVFDPHPSFWWQGKHYNAPIKLLPEWLEFSLQHGVDHFFFYTFKGTEFAAVRVMQPYLDSGLATRTGFTECWSPRVHFRAVDAQLLAAVVLVETACLRECQ